MHSLKKPLVAVLLILAITGCKKTINDIQENRIIDFMVEGQWRVTNFTINTSNTTGTFRGYSFQFHRDKTVDAIKNSVVENTGNWDGDVATKTVWADFTGVIAPLADLNGSWHIDNSSTTYVLLSQTAGSDSKTMRLDKL